MSLIKENREKFTEQLKELDSKMSSRHEEIFTQLRNVGADTATLKGRFETMDKDIRELRGKGV